MKRLRDDINAPLIFTPFGGPMNICAEMVNHGLELPEGKTLLEMGLFTLGHLETNGGNKVEVAKRKQGSFYVHVVARNADGTLDSLPIMIYPNNESNIKISADYFNSYFNCHGLVFSDCEYWINPLASSLNPGNGQMIPNRPNISMLLEDEYERVEEQEQWDCGMLVNRAGVIVHSIKKENDIILSKYDGYQLLEHRSIEEIDDDRYGNAEYEFYRRV